jgi:ABC-2 type transport system ATP-binding protein
MMTPSAGAEMISARGLAKTYRGRKGAVEAVRGVDLDVRRGEIVGFLGPNGAGKTTTLQMLTTLLEPTSGQATVAGHDLRRDPAAVRRAIGYVAQGGSAGSDARVGEELIFQAQFYGMGAADARRRAEELLQRLDLSGLGGRDVKTLSGGQKRRLDIALGLMHSPELIFLDEPTTGLDPQSRSNMWGHIADLRRTAGTTVFITTHYLDEADALCDRILVIDGGRIIAEGTPDELKRGVSGDLVTITVLSDPDAALVLARRLPGATEPVCEPDGDAHTVTFRVPEGERMIIGLLRDLDAAGVPLSGVSVRRPTLDDVFLTLTGRTLREEAA